jgi:colanic acid/amylovoran biosynthesis protein
MKILIIGATLTGNKGASAMCHSLIYNLKKNYHNNVEISVLTPRKIQDYDVSKNLGVKLFKYKNILRKSIINYFFYYLTKKQIFKNDETFEAYLWADYIIDIHGINFTDSDGFISTSLIPSMQILLSYLISVPMIKFTQSFGPMNKISNKIFAKIFLSMALKVFPREKESYQTVKSLNLKNVENDYVDCAFNLPTEKYLNFKKEKDSLIRIGFIPNAILLSKSKNYLEICNKIILELIKNGFKPVIIMHYSKPGSDTIALNKSSNNDYQLIKDLLKKNKDFEKLEIHIEENSPSKLKGIINTCNLVITSRYHALVAALSNNIPCFCLGWSNKYYGLLSRVNLSEYSVNPLKNNLFDETEVIKVLKDFINRFQSIDNNFNNKINTLRDNCAESYIKLFKLIEFNENKKI